MNIITVYGGYECIVDDGDFEQLSKHKLHLDSNGYPSCYIKSQPFRVHRLIVGDTGHDVDHINRNKLDNRRENLRPCSRSENMANRPRNVNNTSGYKGVRKYTANRWLAKIQKDGKHIHIGCFGSVQDAALAYNQKAIELFGDFAYLNTV